MIPRRMIPVLLATIVFGGCDGPTGTGLTQYRDIGWFLQPSDSDHFDFRVDSIGTYVVGTDDGDSATCTVGISIMQGLVWGWVEDVESGQTVAVNPANSGLEGPPYPLLDLHVDTRCDPPVNPNPYFSGTLLVDFYFEPGRGVEGLAHVGWMEAYVGEDPAPAEAIFRRTEVGLPDQISQAHDMLLPLDLTVRLYPEDPEAKSLFEWSDTLELVYTRTEAVNARSTP